MDGSRSIKNVLVSILVANLSVSVAKIAYGYLANSIAMTSDGFHSLFDAVSNVIGLVGVRVASRPPDRRHPYGHRKYETLFTVAIASMIFLTCYQILRSAYGSLYEDRRIVVTSASFVVMAITIAVNIAVVLYEGKKGRELKSDFLLADANHTKSDILTSLSVIAGLIATRLGYPRADAIVGIIIAFVIARIGYGILKTASDVLVDTVCIDTFDLEAVVKTIEGVKGCHGIRTRGTAYSIFLDLHVLVERDVSIEKAHEIADRVESVIRERFPAVTDIVVHTEPEERG